jgi:hypothetical protein
LFGVDSPIGKYFNTGMSHRLQVIGVVEDGNMSFSRSPRGRCSFLFCKSRTARRCC